MVCHYRGTIIKIVDPESLQELPVGEDGLILIGGGQVMKGYLDAPEKTAEVIVEIDGVRYYKTGDKGHIDHNGFITMCIVILDLLKSAAK